MGERRARVEPGATVEATDGRFGMVDQVIVRPETGELAYLVVQRGWGSHRVTLPASLIAATPSRREVHLRATRQEAGAAATTPAPEALLAADHGGELRIPLAEERLVPVKRQVDLGELRVHKRVEQREDTVREQVARDDLQVERVPVGRPLDGPLEPWLDGDWLVIPIMEEVLVVEKRLMLTEEVRIRKRQLTEEREVRDTVRRERIELEDATTHGLDGLGAADATTRLDVARERPAPSAPTGAPPAAPPGPSTTPGAAGER